MAVARLHPLALFFRPSGEGFGDLRRRCAKLFLKLFDALVRGFEFTAQVRDQINEPFGADPPLSRILFERLDGIHTPSILTSPMDLREERLHRMDGYLLDGIESLFRDGRHRDRDESQAIQAELYEQIGRLNMEVEWLKNKAARGG